MEYTVHKLGQLAGISTRTLRYYDEIGILKPARINSSGYRIYGETEVNRLQQILFFRELGVNLDRINEIMSSPSFNPVETLMEHHENLLQRRTQLELLIDNVEKTIALYEGRMNMTDKEKFKGFKQKMINENEEKYGKEIRKKYGEESVHKSYQKIKGMTPEQYEEVSQLANNVIETLGAAMQTGDPAGELAQTAADLHRQWICYYWDSYSKEAHAGLGQMYVDDPRFTEYYDKHQPGMAAFLRDAILIYTEMPKSE